MPVGYAKNSHTKDIAFFQIAKIYVHVVLLTVWKETEEDTLVLSRHGMLSTQEQRDAPALLQPSFPTLQKKNDTAFHTHLVPGSHCHRTQYSHVPFALVDRTNTVRQTRLRSVFVQSRLWTR
jgi:hypothetical protein